ncbi:MULTISPECIES: hypothetical protein [unclassified Pseudoalteromonas]|uniref:hypothetical protein n=1 Tax=unclassified Pseudoalteromonas TaxID=194690 RepID=UPI0015737E90|nr:MULTISPECIES: hypothetical protein [unclassified Pseudoalteromonas]MBR8842222.1 hypothetical protein [Pseudoalteromonas sp. JC3]NSY33145.1 hypothetical protein [Pseudoalteromonas sp. JC28]QUI68263.1 hypothetical protein GSF13_00045 [Pseudoalteromonas sp. M8]WJE11600.1 hypothetical protein QSH61_20995 [Pseudoalteromonas sp. JC3]
MSSKPGIFSFNAAQIASSMRGQYRAVQPYEKLSLQPGEQGLSLVIELPMDARIDDRVNVVLTKHGERNAKCEVSLVVDPESYLTKIVEIKVKQSLDAGPYFMQLNLVGLHDYLKNAAEFDIILNERIIVSEPVSEAITTQTTGFKRIFNSAVSAVLSVF